LPLYEYKCPSCECRYEAVHPVQFRDFDICPDCGERTNRLLSQPAKAVIYEYYSENLGAVVTGPKQKKKLMEEKGVSEYAGKNHREV
jgi:putative FmdB family regulatory protein